MIQVKPYSPDNFEQWEHLLANSKNGTFLHSRNFMEYHKDRFTDASLMVFDDEICVALFPANVKDSSSIESHAGLTYGGLILEESVYTAKSLKYLSTLLEYCYKDGIKEITIKLTPDFYNLITQQEIEFGLFVAEAELVKMDLTCAVKLNSISNLSMQTRRIRGAKDAKKKNVTFEETDDFTLFWSEILEPNLMQRFGVKPVHSVDEIAYLSKKNKGHIRQFNAMMDGKIIGGTTIFETRSTAHAQYISSNETGRDVGALDGLFIYLIENVFNEKRFFNFGKVNEDSALDFNVGLLKWKEGFGARGYAHKYYKINTENYSIINKLFEN